MPRFDLCPRCSDVSYFADEVWIHTNPEQVERWRNTPGFVLNPRLCRKCREDDSSATALHPRPKAAAEYEM